MHVTTMARRSVDSGGCNHQLSPRSVMCTNTCFQASCIGEHSYFPVLHPLRLRQHVGAGGVPASIILAAVLDQAKAVTEQRVSGCEDMQLGCQSYCCTPACMRILVRRRSWSRRLHTTQPQQALQYTALTCKATAC
jgi:hypothetical protein